MRQEKIKPYEKDSVRKENYDELRKGGRSL